MNNQVVFKSEAGKKAILDAYENVLKQWPVHYEALNISTKHGETFIIASGQKSAPPLILIHGTSSNSAMWIGDVAEYSQHYRVYAIDIPGEPGKSEAIRHELTSPAHAEWLEEILKVLGIESASIVGISLGAWMAIQFATIYPARVNKLVLLCPSGIAPQKISFLFKMIPLLFFGKWGIERISRMVSGSKSMPKEVLQYMVLITKQFNPRVVVVPIFKDEELQRLKIPLFMIVGGKDVLLHSRKSASRMQKILPQAKILLLPNAGHVLINLTNQILEFLG